MSRDRRSPLPRLLLWVCGIYLVFLSYGYYFAGSIPHHRLETGGFILVGVAILCSSLVAAVLRRERIGIDPPISLTTPAPSFLLAGYALALTGCLLLYWPVLFTGFFYDDYILISAVVEGQIELGSRLERFRPITFLLWRLLTSIGIEDVGLHFVNVALHAANAVLTYVVAVRLGIPHRHGVAVAAVFITFPTSVEAVAWIAGLPDVLVTFFALIFLAVLPVADSSRATWAAAAALLGALCTKETAIAIPAIAVAVYGWSPGFRRTRKWIMGASLVAAGTFATWRILAPSDFDFLQPPSRYLFQKILSMSVGALAVPWKQAALDSNPAAAFMWTATIVILFTLYFIRCVDDTNASRTVSSFAAWIVLAVAPVYTWFWISPEMEGGRYLYLATPAWSMLLAACVVKNIPRFGTTSGIVIAGVTLGAFVFGVRSSVESWTAASQVRDGVLAAAESVLEETECERIAFLGLPESVNGAFVFRNGFREALEYHGIARVGQVVGSPTDAEPRCRMAWNEELRRFVR